jgi:hypothetical protein
MSDVTRAEFDALRARVDALSDRLDRMILRELEPGRRRRILDSADALAERWAEAGVTFDPAAVAAKAARILADEEEK